MKHIDISKPLEILAGDSPITKRAKMNYNVMTNLEIMRCYQCSKETYAKRVARYGDPYMLAPLARIGKLLARLGF